MFTILPRPAIIPADVSVCAVSWRLADYRAEMFSALGLTLPAAFQNAVPKRQAEFLVGRHCANEAITQAGGCAKDCLDTRDDRSPVWPPGFVGSITHTEGFAAAAVAGTETHHGIGLDTEVHVSAELAQKLAKSVLSDAELEHFDQPPCAMTPETYFSLLFSAKESIYKCLRPQVGTFFGFEAASCFTIEANSAGGLDLQFSLDASVVRDAPGSDVMAVRAFMADPYVHTFTEWRCSGSVAGISGNGLQ